MYWNNKSCWCIIHPRYNCQINAGSAEEYTTTAIYQPNARHQTAGFCLADYVLRIFARENAQWLLSVSSSYADGIITVMPY